MRHHKFGEFKDWDIALEGLAERGYNAIRVDAMPQFVAADSDGRIRGSFKSIKENWTPSLWGNDFTMEFNPRQALLEFLPKCQKYGIKVGLASWFMRHGTDRKGIFNEEGGLLRAWDETLCFLQANNLLSNVVYVDLLNEYPNWHGYDWFKGEMNKRSDQNKFILDNPDANVPTDFNFDTSQGNSLQRHLYENFINSTIKVLRDKYPDLDYFASLDSGMHLGRIDLNNFSALDYHIWFAHKGGIPGLDVVRSRKADSDYHKAYSGLMDFWKTNKDHLINWMDGRISDISDAASKDNIVCGNTEGWGPIWWFDHPGLDWRWVQECADICVDLALKHSNYKFICTSNFTHPQFRGIWNDISWHRQITSRILKG